MFFIFFFFINTSLFFINISYLNFNGFSLYSHTFLPSINFLPLSHPETPHTCGEVIFATLATAAAAPRSYQ